MVEPSSENSASACRSRISASNRRYTSSSAGSHLVASSISPRRRHVVTSSRSTGTPASSTARSDAAISDSGMPKKRRIDWRYSVAPATASRNASVRTAPFHMGCSSRGGPGSNAMRCPESSSHNPGAVPRGAHRMQMVKQWPQETKIW